MVPGSHYEVIFHKKIVSCWMAHFVNEFWDDKARETLITCILCMISIEKSYRLEHLYFNH